MTKVTVVPALSNPYRVYECHKREQAQGKDSNVMRISDLVELIPALSKIASKAYATANKKPANPKIVKEDSKMPPFENPFP